MNPCGELLRLVCLSIKTALKDADMASILLWGPHGRLQFGHVEYVNKIGQSPDDAFEPLGCEMFEKRGKLMFGRRFSRLVQYSSRHCQRDHRHSTILGIHLTLD